MQDYLDLIDTDTPGPRCDVTPLFADPQALQALVAELAEPFENLAFDYVAGLDALGFILGTALALRLGKGFIAVRKGGKLPVSTLSRRFTDYTGQEKVLEIRTDLLGPGDRVLVADEWVETGAQISAAVALIEQQGAVVIGIAAIDIDHNPVPQQLKARYFCHALWHDGQRLP